MICPNCKNELNDQAVFCNMCGCNIKESLAYQNQRHCIRCQAIIGEKAKFCTACGAKADEAISKLEDQEVIMEVSSNDIANHTVHSRLEETMQESSEESIVKEPQNEQEDGIISEKIEHEPEESRIIIETVQESEENNIIEEEVQQPVESNIVEEAIQQPAESNIVEEAIQQPVFNESIIIGADNEKQAFCKVCAMKLKDGANFCTSCGANQSEADIKNVMDTTSIIQQNAPVSTPDIMIKAGNPNQEQPKKRSAAKTAAIIAAIILSLCAGLAVGYFVMPKIFDKKPASLDSLDNSDEMVTPALTQKVEEVTPIPTLTPTPEPTVTPVPEEKGFTLKPKGSVILPADYNNIILEYDIPTVSDLELEAEIKAVLYNYKERIEITDKKKVVKKGDIVHINYTGFIIGGDFSDVIPDTYEGLYLEIGVDSFIDGFDQQLIGSKTGDEVSVYVTIPVGFWYPYDLEDAVFEVTINAIYNDIYPELTDEFVNSLGYYSVDDFEEMLRLDILLGKEIEIETNIINDAFLYLINNSIIIGIDEDEILENADIQMFSYLSNAQYFNLTEEEYIKKFYNLTYDELYQQIFDYLKESFEHYLILYAIIDKEGIVLEEDEYEEGLVKYADKVGYYSVEELKQDYADEELREYVLLYMAEEFIKNNITVLYNDVQ